MEKDLGSEGKLKAEMIDGKVRLSVEYDGKQLDAGAYVSADADQLVDALEAMAWAKGAVAKGGLEVLRVVLKNIKA